MFFVLEKNQGDYQLSFLPWDTDMSWGTVWKAEAGGFVYDFEQSRQNDALRIEYEWMLKFCPDLNQKMAQRWFELRDGLLTMENVTAILQREQAILDASGAWNRDAEHWGLFYEGADSLEDLYRSVEARFAWADEYYSQYLQ